MRDSNDVLATLGEIYDDPEPPMPRKSTVGIYGFASEMVMDQRMPYQPLRTNEPDPMPVRTWEEMYG